MDNEKALDDFAEKLSIVSLGVSTMGMLVKMDADKLLEMLKEQIKKECREQMECGLIVFNEDLTNG